MAVACACLRGNLQEPQEPFHVTQLASITQNYRLPYSFTRPQGFSSVPPADNCFCLELQPLAAVLQPPLPVPPLAPGWLICLPEVTTPNQPPPKWSKHRADDLHLDTRPHLIALQTIQPAFLPYQARLVSEAIRTFLSPQLIHTATQQASNR